MSAEVLCACCGKRPHGTVTGAIYITEDSVTIPYVVCAECMRLPENDRLARVELRLEKAAGHA